jgi:hypothetical protein
VIEQQYPQAVLLIQQMNNYFNEKKNEKKMKNKKNENSSLNLIMKKVHDLKLKLAIELKNSIIDIPNSSIWGKDEKNKKIKLLIDLGNPEMAAEGFIASQVFMYIYISICRDLYIYMYIHVYTCIHALVYTSMKMAAERFVSSQVYIYKYECIWILIYLWYIYGYLYIYVCKYMGIFIYRFFCRSFFVKSGICVYIFMNIYMYILTHD